MSDVTVISALIGNEMVSVRRHDGDTRKLVDLWSCSDNTCLDFEFGDGRVYRFTHDQNCCESVDIDDICGDLQDLVGAPILTAEERSNRADTENGSETWTFYEFRTVKGSVTVKWHGSSNGYYSESVDHGFLAQETPHV